MLKRILWQRTGGYWLFYASAIYLAIGMYSVFIEEFCPIEYIQIAWILIISIPLWFKPLARWLNMKTMWEV